MNKQINMNAAEGYTSETSQRELAAGVLKQAAQDLRRFNSATSATSAIERELYLDAYSWLTSDDSSWPFSFLNVCQLLNLTPDIVRHELVADTSGGFFTYWTRRSVRAARSFQIFLNRVFTTNRNEIAVDPVPLTHVPIV
jgi:hypothetical protein